MVYAVYKQTHTTTWLNTSCACMRSAVRCPYPCLGSDAVRLRMTAAEEAATCTHLNLSATNCTPPVGPYHVDAAAFRLREPSKLSWIDFNPSVLTPALGILYNIKPGGSGALGAGRFPGVARTSLLWLQKHDGRAFVRHEIRNAEDARAVFVNGTAYATFTRYRGHKLKDVWLARLERPFREVIDS